MSAPKPPVRSWSFSLLKDYEACPYRVYLARVERQPQPEPDDPNHPLVRGDRIHHEAEDYIRGTGPLTKDLRKVESTLNELRFAFDDGQVEVEQKWGFDREWTPVEWDAGECWLRVICDVVRHMDNDTLEIVDWKTGKSFGNEVKHTQQRQLYAIAAFMRYPNATHVKARMLYTDEGKEKSNHYDRSMLAQMQAQWDKRGGALTNALTFPPKPNRGNCKYCPFGIANGTGVCAYSVEA